MNAPTCSALVREEARAERRSSGARRLASSIETSEIGRVHYLLFYSFVDGMVERRAPFRQAHLAHLEAAVARGELVLAGALADPLDGAVLLFTGAAPDAAEALAKTDPYVLNGLVTRWQVRTWSTVVGLGAATPVASSSLG